jgi:hypothetical protein
MIITQTYKEILSAIAILLTFLAFLPYIHSIMIGATRPHVFSWIIWGITTSIVFFAQLNAKGGVGAWPIGISGVVTLSIAVLAYTKRSEISIKRIDWIFFFLALSSLPLWALSSNPLWAILILTIVDLLGFCPTIIKVLKNPNSESIVFYGLFLVRNIIVILALESYSVTTIMFPLVISIACGILISIIYYKRIIIKTIVKK